MFKHFKADRDSVESKEMSSIFKQFEDDSIKSKVSHISNFKHYKTDRVRRTDEIWIDVQAF